jgi:transposase-like protein
VAESALRPVGNPHDASSGTCEGGSDGAPDRRDGLGLPVGTEAAPQHLGSSSARRTDPAPWRDVGRWPAGSRSRSRRDVPERGEKSDPHLGLDDLPRRRASKSRGRGTYENDRLPVVEVVGRETGWACSRVCVDTKEETVRWAAAREAAEEACIFTDENRSCLWLESFYGSKTKRNPEPGKRSITLRATLRDTLRAGPRIETKTASGRPVSVQPERTRRACVTACGAFAGFTKATYPDT